jgi:colanic acid/amylovoran biosynthesis glycosyltransferase
MSASPRSSSALEPPGPIAYLTPEFPGQTHTWIWREVEHMREWGVDIRLFSTQPPDDRSAARHAFAERARNEAFYLWPRPLRSVVAAVSWAGLTRPGRFLRAIALVLTLDGMSLRERAATTPLVAAACIFAREAAAQGIRHVHLHSAARSAVIAMMAKRLIGIPYSIALNANLEWWGGGMASKLGQAEFTAVNANWLLDQVRNDYPDLLPSQMLLARPGVDTETWLPGDRGSDDSTFELVTVARVHHAKGHDITIRGIARLRQSGRNVRLRIVGSGPELNSLQSLAGQLRLEGEVEFLGSVSEDEVIAYLRAADAFVLASRFEPLGVAYMEAMALGLPTIGTDAGGVGEIITPERDGLLVPPEDDEQLANAVARLMDDPELRRRLGENARRTIVERFDSRIGAASLYERLFGTPPPRAGPSDPLAPS